jgi:Tfp pilus assembly protein PilV
MSKYEPLTHYLERSKDQVVELTFAEIERIIGGKLPASSLRHRALWSNNPVGHVMTQAWLAAGFESEQVDMARKRVKFRRTEAATAEPKRSGKQLFDDLYGCMRGTVSIPKGIDIMEPVDLEWDAMKE